MEQYLNKSSGHVWPWIEDMKINETAHIETGAVEIVRDDEGVLTFYIEKYCTCLPAAGSNGETLPITRLAEAVWEVDFASSLTPTPKYTTHIKIFSRNKTAYEEDYYGPFSFEQQPQVFDKNNLEVQYSVLVTKYDDILADGDHADDEKAEKLEAEIKVLLPQYLMISSLQSPMKKLDFLAAWRMRSDDLSDYIEKLLVPYFEAIAKEEGKLPVQLLAVLVKDSEEVLWETFVKSLPDQRISEYAVYEYSVQEATYDDVEAVIDSVYSSYQTDFGKRVYAWYKKVLLPLYKIEWDNFVAGPSSHEVEERYEKLSHAICNKEEITADDLFWLIKQANEREDWRLLAKIQGHPQHALMENSKNN